MYDEIRARIAPLIARIEALRGHLEIDAKRARLEELERQSALPEFWADQAVAGRVLKEKGAIERTVSDWDTLRRQGEDLGVLIDLAIEVEDEAAAREAEEGIGALEGALKALETQRLLRGEFDALAAIVEITPGAGGTDAADWAQLLMRMVTRWAERRGFQIEVLDVLDGEEAGIKSASLAIRGPYAYGYLQSEIGVHRLVRISPFDNNARRQTAFAALYAYPEIDDDIEVDINPADLDISTMRSGGAGGQHVNKTESAVRIVHRPTGVAVRCDAERSQHKNKDRAMKMLKARLFQLELEKRQAAQDAANAKKMKIDFGSQIRSYVMQPYQQVKDLRTDQTTGDVSRVLDGDLQPFMEAWLAARAEGRLGDGVAADAS
ncbi:MAG TPA: peptide chain release factor 2 [Myxococcota bacterium]|nr:peptide chain release factor 2 [Myxococcota bacterium]